MLLNDLLSNVTKEFNFELYTDIENSLNNIHNLVTYINEKKKFIENLEMMKSIQHEYNIKFNLGNWIKDNNGGKKKYY
jgi:hypothetical protein